MGFAGLLTSDLFKLPSSLDRITQQALDTDTFLSRKDNLTEQETQRLKDAQKVLRHAEFRHSFRDPLMEEYSRARSELVESKSSCGDGLLEHPGSPMRRRVARKLLMKTIGISIDSEKEDKK
jgi:hypothetical protein